MFEPLRGSILKSESVFFEMEFARHPATTCDDFSDAIAAVSLLITVILPTPRDAERAQHAERPKVSCRSVFRD
jgi:hypothetical protein